MMKKIDRFPDLDAVRAEKLRLDAVRRAHASRLEEHVSAFGESHFRRAMAKDAVNSFAESIIPGGLMGALAGSGGVASGLGLALGTGKGGWARRIGLFALGTLAPSLVQRLEAVSLPQIGHEFRVSFERLKKHVRERKAERAEP